MLAGAVRSVDELRPSALVAYLVGLVAVLAVGAGTHPAPSEDLGWLRR